MRVDEVAVLGNLERPLTNNKKKNEKPVLGDTHGPKPYKFIGFGDTHGPKPYKFIGFGDPN